MVAKAKVTNQTKIASYRSLTVPRENLKKQSTLADM